MSLYVILITQGSFPTQGVYFPQQVVSELMVVRVGGKNEEHDLLGRTHVLSSSCSSGKKKILF